jgi:hypothetical protein
MIPPALLSTANWSKKSFGLHAIMAGRSVVALARIRLNAPMMRMKRWKPWTGGAFGRSKPPGFSHPDSLKAYEHVVGEGLAVTDDASAWESTGRQAQLVDTAGLNLKITRTQDWEVAELWLNREAGRGVRDDLHAINNALSPMTGYLPLLEKQLPAGGTERDYVEKISASLHRTIPLIERLQDKLRELFPVAKNGIDTSNTFTLNGFSPQRLMVPEEDKSYNLANVVMSIGILLTIVPIGFFMITGYATPGLSAKELIGVGFWFLVMALLPIGLAFLSWVWAGLLSSSAMPKKRIWPRMKRGRRSDHRTTRWRRRRSF